VRLNPIYRWHHPTTTATRPGRGWRTADRTSFIFNPLIEDPNVPGGLLCGTYRVWRSPDRGVSWTAISPDLSNGAGVIYALAAV
jgi:hypothetical protein